LIHHGQIAQATFDPSSSKSPKLHPTSYPTLFTTQPLNFPRINSAAFIVAFTMNDTLLHCRELSASLQSLKFHQTFHFFPVNKLKISQLFSTRCTFPNKFVNASFYFNFPRKEHHFSIPR
jgi:hypothetical protein